MCQLWTVLPNVWIKRNKIGVGNREKKRALGIFVKKNKKYYTNKRRGEFLESKCLT